MKLDYAQIEYKWKKNWEASGLYRVSEDPSRPKFYVLDMFPYPSGAGLHVGHPLGYVASDIYSRYKRMKGFNVLHPMGFDAFGLPAEQYALDTGVHPADSTRVNTERYRGQLDNLGCSFDWSREVSTHDPAFYRWTQWIFLQLYQHYYDPVEQKAKPISQLESLFAKYGSEGVNATHARHTPFTDTEWKQMSEAAQHQMLMNYRLAFRKAGYVNWCEALGTVLANDEVKDGVSERGGFPVVQKEMLQWSLRITAYAERLLSGLDDVDWSESLKTIQRNWIGRSEGAYVDFRIQGHDAAVRVFTTRPDTIYGCTFMVLAPDHDLVSQITTSAQRSEVDAFVHMVKQKAATARESHQKQSNGVFTGAMAIHPITKETIPVWIADYVLKDYGTGAIMAVPGDDERDQQFAKTYNLPIVEIIDRSAIPDAEIGDRNGVMIHSDFLNGKKVPEAIETMIQYLEAGQLGERRVEYKLRDANFSRQRYWGEPFPIYYDAHGTDHALKESDLPLELPPLTDFKPSPDGRSPLARLKEWVHPQEGMTRETDTMPGYAGSSWYFLRYMDPGNNNSLASDDAINYWRDVDLYVGGIEHAVGHLLYSRFWHKFLYDLGYVPTQEPFRKLVNQGMIQGVVEYAALLKEKVDGQSRFISMDLIKSRNLPESDYSRIPVHISFVRNYGSAQSYLDASGIQSFTEWRPEFGNAVFETPEGNFTAGTPGEFKFLTISEVGKMSKRYHNVVNPDDVIAEYGADCFRMYEMFLGPVEQSKPWDMMGIEGVSKFLRKFSGLFYTDEGNWRVSSTEPSAEAQRVLHATIKKVAEDIENFSFNTAISQMMICVNELRKGNESPGAILEPLVCVIAPFAPFLAEELWEKLGHSSSVHLAPYPAVDEKWLVVNSITYPVCVNGKKRAELELPKGLPNAEMEAQAKALPEIIKWIDGKAIRKVIIVPEKMINIVV